MQLVRQLNEHLKNVYYKNIDAKRRRFYRQAEIVFYGALQKQLKIIIDAVRDRQDLTHSIFLERNPIKDAFYRVYINTGKEFARQAFAQVELAKQNEDDIWESEMISFVNTTAATKITSINGTSIQKVRELLIRYSSEGLGIDEIARRLRTDWRNMSTWRARAIARTEIIAASNYGALQGAKTTGFEMQKIWLSTRDNATRDPHLMADGQRVQMYSKFNVGGELLEYPGDPAGSAGNVINCRCTIIFEPI